MSVTELSEYIKNTVSNKKIKLSGEVSQPKLSNGNLYFTIKDNNNNIKAIIWKFKNINKDLIKDGENITVECKLDYYGGNGSISLIIDKLITSNGLGDLHIQYEKIKNEFIKKGYLDSNREKLFSGFKKIKSRNLKETFKNILLITSETGAALQDFVHNIQSNNCNIDFDISDVVVQGVDCPKNICDVLNKLKEDKAEYDLVIIMRGGGSLADLFGFSQPELIECVYNFHLPVLSAIGHQIDNPLLDLVADISTPTPSLAAQFVIDYNKKYLEKLNNIKNTLKIDIINNINEELNKYNKLNEKINNSFNYIVNLKNELKNNLKDFINSELVMLSRLESKLDFKNNDITLYDNNNKISNPEELNKFLNKTITLKWNNSIFKIHLEK